MCGDMSGYFPAKSYLEFGCYPDCTFCYAKYLLKVKKNLPDELVDKIINYHFLGMCKNGTDYPFLYAIHIVIDVPEIKPIEPEKNNTI
jgi:hypothetical protein